MEQIVNVVFLVLFGLQPFLVLLWIRRCRVVLAMESELAKTASEPNQRELDQEAKQ